MSFGSTSFAAAILRDEIQRPAQKSNAGYERGLVLGLKIIGLSSFPKSDQAKALRYGGQ